MASDPDIEEFDGCIENLAGAAAWRLAVIKAGHGTPAGYALAI